MPTACQSFCQVKLSLSLHFLCHVTPRIIISRIQIYLFNSVDYKKIYSISSSDLQTLGIHLVSLKCNIMHRKKIKTSFLTQQKEDALQKSMTFYHCLIFMFNTYGLLARSHTRNFILYFYCMPKFIKDRVLLVYKLLKNCV